MSLIKSPSFGLFPNGRRFFGVQAYDLVGFFAGTLEMGGRFAMLPVN
jgi:hypothetical protein